MKSNKFTEYKKIIKFLFPPFVLYFINKYYYKSISTFEVHNSWASAVKASEGYDSKLVLEKVRSAAKLVRDGNATYERDAIVFDKIEYSFPLLASLLFAAANSSSLRVIDFGGALGTTYQQNQKFISHLIFKCDWRVVEQPNFVSVGKSEFSNECLSFYNTIDEAILNGVDVMLFGSSICYVSNPYEYIKNAIDLNIPYIIIDRTPFNKYSYDTFMVQKVPSTIYEASYPLRVFSYKNFIDMFKANYILIEEWTSELQGYPKSTAMGFIFKKIIL